MSGIEDEINHHDRWCYFATHLEELVRPLRNVLDIIEGECVHTEDSNTFNELSTAQQILRYEVNFYEGARATLALNDFRTIPHELYAMYRDLLKGRMVIFNNFDIIHDSVGHSLSEFIEATEVVGEADVMWVDGAPHLVNKRWTAPEPNTMFYDHFPSGDEETLAVLEDGQAQCDITGWAIRLDMAIIPKQRF